ncbi:DUF2510 domain-containing protein [Homoserinibacter sp. YIM 151385]|uniref:DUF2510 domain-containing protein n=1 Tax=Homoserinibacter sp. YIM 151385 TaxID=2985506 RepID=UPI0022F0BF61|nr:DUF2510 domain-containing protein [Homoserinibacter sp. YIM 151385]WBU37930.1 DUF2510 domain-containing protein [Homoserinibacter sp. YIM 151385]
MSATPAGWYLDPATGRQRWWDGAAWSAYFADEHLDAPGARQALGLPAAPGAPGSAPGAPPRRQVPVAGVVFIVLGAGGLVILFGAVIMGMLLAAAGA